MSSLAKNLGATPALLTNTRREEAWLLLVNVPYSIDRVASTVPVESLVERTMLVNRKVLLALVKSNVSDNAPKLVLLLLFTEGVTEAFFAVVLAAFNKVLNAADNCAALLAV